MGPYPLEVIENVDAKRVLSTPSKSCIVISGSSYETILREFSIFFKDLSNQSIIF